MNNYANTLMTFHSHLSAGQIWHYSFKVTAQINLGPNKRGCENQATL